MASLSPQLLERAPEESARWLALSFVDEAMEAAGRFADPEDKESLHDFRVALRRLRSTLRAYRPYLKGSLSKKWRRRLRDLARSTNEPRDLEVAVEWLEAQRQRLQPRELIGLERLLSGLKERQAAVADARLVEAAQTFRDLRETLVDRLSRCSMRLQLHRRHPIPTFRSAIGRLLSEHAETLRAELGRISGPNDDPHIHQSRIYAKRLRYLMEPLRKGIAETKPPVARLKKLQDGLGMLHDTQLLAESVSKELEASAIDSAHRLGRSVLENRPAEEPVSETDLAGDPSLGLVALLRILRERRDTLFAQLEPDWLGGAGDGFFESLAALAAKLHPASLGARRRFVLEAVPERVKTEGSTLVEEGWLPGKRIREVLRRTRSGRKITRQRMVEDDAGHARAEEPVARRLFEPLWELTSARRLRRRRYTIVESGNRWVVDELLDRPLVLAEAVPERPDGNLVIPEWIAACGARDVTGDARFEARSLARPASNDRPDTR